MQIRNKWKSFVEAFAPRLRHQTIQERTGSASAQSKTGAGQGPNAAGRERRRYPRLKCAGKSPFSLEAVCQGLGPILDIGQGGFAVLMEDEANGGAKPQSVDLYFANNMFCLKQVPCALVSFRETQQGGGAHAGTRFRAHYRFLNLSEGQRNKLLAAIRLNAVVGVRETSDPRAR